MKKKQERDPVARPRMSVPIGLRRQLWHRKPTEVQFIIVQEIVSALDLPQPELRSAAAAYRWIREVGRTHGEQILKIANGE